MRGFESNPRITPEERAAQVAAKIAASHVLPPAEAIRNSGRRRTPEKRALPERIAEVRARLEGQRSESGEA